MIFLVCCRLRAPAPRREGALVREAFLVVALGAGLASDFTDLAGPLPAALGLLLAALFVDAPPAPLRPGLLVLALLVVFLRLVINFFAYIQASSGQRQLFFKINNALCAWV